MASTGAIEEYFRHYFRHWKIALPARDVASRAGGHIFERGWHVGYVWGSEQGDEYLEVAAHEINEYLRSGADADQSDST